MSDTLPNLRRAGKRATVKNKSVNIIHGAYRVRGCDWLDVIGMVCNGYGLIRDGGAYRMVYSEAFEQWALS